MIDRGRAEQLYALLVVRSRALSTWARDEEGARAQWDVLEVFLAEDEAREALGAWEARSRADWDAVMHRITSRFLEMDDLGALT